MEYIVDVQGFKKPLNEFVVKELAIVPLNSNFKPLVFLFKPPTSWCRLPARYRSENLWLERNYHGLAWSSGELPYEELENVLQSVLHDASLVHVKGVEKKQWLEKFKFHVRDMGDMGFPSLQKLKTEILESLCPYHRLAYKANCAHRNVLLLKKFHRDNTPSLERSLRIFYRTEHLSFMSPKDIAQLPKEFLITFAANSIELAWDKLSEHLKQDSEILLCLRCREHNLIENGIPPLRRDCTQCKAEH